jgi:Integrase core domain
MRTSGSVATVTRWLHKLDLNRLDHLDADGERLRKPGKIAARYSGHMIHLNVTKVGRITDGGGWHICGANSDQTRAVASAKVRGTRPGYVFLHSAIDGFSRLACTGALADETAATAIGFLFGPAAWFQVHGISRFSRIVTDNGSCYRAEDFSQAVGSFARRHEPPRTNAAKRSHAG